MVASVQFFCYISAMKRLLELSVTALLGVSSIDQAEFPATERSEGAGVNA